MEPITFFGTTATIKLWQYDYGVQIPLPKIEYITAGMPCQWHYTGVTGVDSRTITEDDGKLYVAVPDAALQQTGAVTGYIYVHDATTGRTRYSITLEIVARPSTDDTPSADEVTYIGQLVVAAEQAAADAVATAEQIVAARMVIGAYNAGTAYVPGNEATYNGSTYRNTVACTGVLPTVTDNWILISQKGTDGATGAAATVEVGTVTTGEAGTDAAVSNSGTTGAAVFDFTIPRGATGAAGADGDDGRGIVSVVRTSGTGAAGTTDTYTITYTDATTSTFDVYNGANPVVVNDLTTGGADKALSAEQGKILSTSISDLNADFNSTTSHAVYANLLDKNDPDYSLGKYVDPSSGALYSNANYNTSGFIPVHAGDRIIITTQHYARRCFDSIPYIAVYNSSKVRVSGSGASWVPSYVVPSGGAFIRLSFSVTSESTTAIEKFARHGISNTLLTYGETVNNIISGVKDVDIFVPAEIYVAQGYPIEIYFDAICPKRRGYTIDANVSGKGLYPEITVKSDKLQIAATNIGGKRVILSVLDGDGNVVGAKLTTIIVVAASAVTKTILPIGDSLTNNKAWLAEMIKMNNNISFVGSTSFSVADSGGTIRSGKHQGISGVSARKLLQDATANPFWDATLNSGTGGFSFNYYVANTLLGVSPDVVMLYLGMNDEGYAPEKNAGYVKNMVDAIRADAPATPIIIITPQYRSYYGEPQYADITYRFMATVYGQFSSYPSLYIVPLGLMHDSANNYTVGTEAVNPRSSITQPRITDATHPQVSGQYQTADAMFGTFSKYFTT
jgi:lysophospholipase L1-like esterase